MLYHFPTRTVFSELDRLQREMNRLFERSFAPRLRSAPSFPAMNVWTNDAIFVVADMPDMNENSVDITLEKNILSIQGLVEPVYPEGYSVAYIEYEDGDFQRRFTLNDKINQDKIEATLREGVLRLKLPKIVPTQRKISVKAG